MSNQLSEARQRFLTVVFERGAEGASQALSKWLGRPARLSVSAIEDVSVEEATSRLGAEDRLLAACVMELHGRLTGSLVLAFEDRSGLALVDFLLERPLGTTVEWGEIEQSAALETANIVGCAYLNALASHLPAAPGGDPADAAAEELLPGPPQFRQEFAASLLEFALMDQALWSDRVLFVRTQFTAIAEPLDWSLLLIPSRDAMMSLLSSSPA